MKIIAGLVVASFGALGLVVACGGDVNAPAEGTEGQHCFANDTCNDGLTCVSRFCVRTPGGDDASVGDAAAADGGPEGSADATIDHANGDGSMDAALDGSTSIDAHVVDASADSAPDAACVGSPQKVGQYLSDPVPTQSVVANGYVLHKELTAYNNYGAQDGLADILYDQGEVGVWTFPIPAGNVTSATVVLSLVLDDGMTPPPPSQYSFQLWAGGTCQIGSVGQLQHGMPFATRFTNWTQLTFPATVVAGTTYTLTVLNTSMTGLSGWMAVDWIEVHVVTQ